MALLVNMFKEAPQSHCDSKVLIRTRLCLCAQISPLTLYFPNIDQHKAYPIIFLSLVRMLCHQIITVPCKSLTAVISLPAVCCSPCTLVAYKHLQNHMLWKQDQIAGCLLGLAGLFESWQGFYISMPNRGVNGYKTGFQIKQSKLKPRLGSLHHVVSLIQTLSCQTGSYSGAKKQLPSRNGLNLCRQPLPHLLLHSPLYSYKEKQIQFTN